MSSTNDPKSLRGRSARVTAGVAISAALILGTIAGPAQARWGDRDENQGYHHYYNGGYYRAPPVTYYGGYYGNGYSYGPGYGYSPPPVVYGPSVGLSLPFVSLGIR